MKTSLTMIICLINIALFAQSQAGNKTNASAANVTPVILQYDELKPFQNDWAAFRTGNKWGFIDKAGKVVVEPQFDFEPYLKFDLIHVGIGYQKHAKIYDKSGMLRIDSQPYYLLNGFTDSLYTTACTYGDGAKGVKPERLLLDRYGNVILKLENEGTYSGSVYCTQTPHEGRIWFNIKDNYKKNGFMDLGGIPVIEPQYVQVRDFVDNRAWVKKQMGNGEELWGAIDRNGIVMVPFIYPDEPKRDFEMDRCFAWKGDHYVLIDNYGQQLSALKFRGAANFNSKDITVARIEENYEELYVLIDYYGKVVKRFEKPAPGAKSEQIFLKSGFNSGLATATYGIFGKMGAIDKTGKVVIPFEFESIDSFSCERALASRTDKTGAFTEGIIDTHGNFILLKAK